MTIPQKLKERFPKLRGEESLKSHCTFRVGGNADFFYELTDIQELPALITVAEQDNIPYRIIGRGTNVLFTDKGFRGLIIKNLSKECSLDGTSITADSGVLLSQIIRLSIENDLTGLEPLYGLPGSLGGAVWGNAGVPGTETGRFVTAVTLFNMKGGVREVKGDQIIFKYRWTSLQGSGDIVMKATLELYKGAKEKSKEMMKKIDEIRRGKQPIGYSAGSFFKNPSPEKSAGYLLDQAGMKGMSVGDAAISDKHANFFLNKGNATASQILELAEKARKKVREKFGVELEMEVKVIGET